MRPHRQQPAPLPVAPLPSAPLREGAPAQSILTTGATNPSKRKQRGFASTILSGAIVSAVKDTKSILGG